MVKRCHARVRANIEGKHLCLKSGQGFFRSEGFFRSGGADSKRARNLTREIVFLGGLFEQAEGTGAFDTFAHRGARTTGENDCRYRVTGGLHMFQQVGTAHTRHVEIEQKTAIAAEKVFEGLFRIYEGASDVQKVVIARQIGK